MLASPPELNLGREIYGVADWIRELDEKRHASEMGSEEEVGIALTW
jgi:hypothetical protein